MLIGDGAAACRTMSARYSRRSIDQLESALNDDEVAFGISCPWDHRAPGRAATANAMAHAYESRWTGDIKAHRSAETSPRSLARRVHWRLTIALSGARAPMVIAEPRPLPARPLQRGVGRHLVTRLIRCPGTNKRMVSHTETRMPDRCLWQSCTIHANEGFLARRSVRIFCTEPGRYRRAENSEDIVLCGRDPSLMLPPRP